MTDEFNTGWPPSRTSIDRILLILACVGLVGRFVGLADSPPGFSNDEAMGAANLACLGETGHDAEGVRLPLFATGAAGGFYTPVYLYFGALWTKLFGISIPAIRSVAAMFGAFTILGVYLTARKLGGARAGFWALILASLSPWGFQFSRVAWDPPVAAAFVIWFCYLWLLDRPILAGALSGAAFALALYSYPPARAQAPLLFGFLYLYTRRAKPQLVSRSLSFSAFSLLLAVPLLMRMLNPTFAGRGNGLAIFTSEYLQNHHGIWAKSFYFVRNLLDNLSLHLRPSFLFLTGDECHRHSSQFMGQLGLVDDLALALGVAWAIARIRGRPGRTEAEPPSGRLVRMFVIGVVGFMLGILPAALTWEGVPHALRGIGAWPFVAIAGASVLTTVERQWRIVPMVAAAVGLLHVGVYGGNYFVTYPAIGSAAFNAQWNEAHANPARVSREERQAECRDDTAAFMYFMMASGRYNCDQAASACARWAQP